MRTTVRVLWKDDFINGYTRWVMGKRKPNYFGVLGWTSLYQDFIAMKAVRIRTRQIHPAVGFETSGRLRGRSMNSKSAGSACLPPTRRLFFLGVFAEGKKTSGSHPLASMLADWFFSRLYLYKPAWSQKNTNKKICTSKNDVQIFRSWNTKNICVTTVIQLAW